MTVSADVRTRRSCPVVLLSTRVRYRMVTVGQGARNGQGGEWFGARGESGDPSPRRTGRLCQADLFNRRGSP